jgi:vancomycin resistance protein YoaR
MPAKVNLVKYIHIMRTNTLTTPPIYARPRQGPPALLQALLTMLIGASLFVVLLGMAASGYSLAYAEKIYPGVSIAGIDLSGLTPSQASERLSATLQYPQNGKIVFQEGSQVWIAKPQEVGFFLDAQTTVQAAYLVGRSGGLLARAGEQFNAWSENRNLPPLFVFDERIAQNYLRKIADQVDIPIIEASLSVNGTDVVVRSGQVGRNLDVSAALTALKAHLPSLTDGILPLTVRETPPVILDASAQADFARRILSAPLTITVPEAVSGDPGPWTFQPDQLAGMLVIERVEDAQGARYQVGLDSAQLRSFLDGVAPSFSRTSENARFIFNDDTRQLELIQSAVIGRALDIETSLQQIKEKVTAGEHTAGLDMEYTEPPVTDSATGESLGIRELVSSYNSYFYGSSNDRIQNIQMASARFHGLLVPPGATFSMSDALGEISLDNGYAEALIILGDRTIKGVGGGVCQVSTTLFRTVFFGGYPVVERHPHAYRVGYYEQTSGGGHDADLAGLDATVFVPVVDFKFTNDTPYWLLMETYLNVASRRLTWKFYSTSDGRSVNWDTTGPTNVVEPPEPSYEENASLSEGTIKQVDWEAEGADITVSRTVMRDGSVLYQDTFTTHYLPWRAVYQYGPGTEIPTPEPEN